MSLLETLRSYLPGSAPVEQPASSKDDHSITPEEVQAHPEFPYVHWDLKPDKTEKIDVAAGRGGPFKLNYELHGHGPKKIVVSSPNDAS